MKNIVSPMVSVFLRDASPPKMVNGFGLNFGQSRILVAIAPGVPPGELKMYNGEILCQSCTDKLC